MDSLFLALPLSVLFYFLWNALAPIYFYFLPSVYLQIPFWHAVGLALLAATVRTIVIPSPVVVNKLGWRWGKKA